MKALVQRVLRSSVTGNPSQNQLFRCKREILLAVGDREVSSIGQGMCVLLGISRYDTQKEAEWM